MTLLEALIISVVEGLTEFLPVSSTGHMIITQALLGVESSAFTKTFIVGIQFGAILSVVALYFKRFLQSINFYLLLFVAFLPAAFLGLLFSDIIDELLESVPVVGAMLLIGGIILVFVDKWFASNEEKPQEPMTYKTALIIGFFQTIAMIPGVSRSAATIIGGLTQGMNRKGAAEFSFFLAVPTMAAATAYKLLKTFLDGEGFTQNELSLFLFGNVVSFIVAMFAIKFFINFLTKNGFKIFGYYRIVVGLIILILFALDIPMEIM